MKIYILAYLAHCFALYLRNLPIPVLKQPNNKLNNPIIKTCINDNERLPLGSQRLSLFCFKYFNIENIRGRNDSI